MVNKEKLKQITIAAFREYQENESLNYDRMMGELGDPYGPPLGWTKDRTEALYSDRAWERKIKDFSVNNRTGVLSLDRGSYSLELSPSSEAYQHNP